MNYSIIHPSRPLSPYIRHYWVMEAENLTETVWERIIPTGNIELMFHFKNSFISEKDHLVSYQPRSFVSGISSSFFNVAANGNCGVIAVTFLPWGACNFFDFHLSEIEETSVDLGDIFCSEIRRIEERICEACTLKRRVHIIEEFLFDKLKPVKSAEFHLLQESINTINTKKGQCRTGELAKKLNVSAKNLERKFSAFVGKTPKQFSRIVRFQEIIRCMSSGQSAKSTDLAYDNGYFDQAHFIKDFKTLSGYTPSEFLNLGPCHSDYFYP